MKNKRIAIYTEIWWKIIQPKQCRKFVHLQKNCSAKKSGNAVIGKN